MLDSNNKLKVNTSNHFTVDEYGVIFVDPQFLIKKRLCIKTKWKYNIRCK